MEQDIKRGVQDMMSASGMEAVGGVPVGSWASRALGISLQSVQKPLVPPAMPPGSQQPPSSSSEPWEDTETTLEKL